MIAFFLTSFNAFGDLEGGSAYEQNMTETAGRVQS